jgi:hypothetical protein
MKSLRVLFIAFLSFAFFNMNAQVFLGGNAGFNFSNHKSEGLIDQESFAYNLDISPLAGIFLSEKVAIGLSLRANLAGTNTATISRSSVIGIIPFLRYYAFKWNKFSVYGQGNIRLEFGNSSQKTGEIKTDGPKQTIASLNIFPGLAYDISDKFSLQTSINILSLGYSYAITKSETSKNQSSGFNIGAGLGNILSLNALTIGAIYKF